MKDKTNLKTKTVTTAIKRSMIAENFINNIDCANIYMHSRFGVFNHFNNVSDLVRLEAISTIFYKPKLCTQKNVEYKVS